LIQGWSTGDLDPSQQLTQHLDNCLLCRACEKICPAEVPFGKLIDNFRSQTEKPKQALVIRFASQASRSLLQSKKLTNRVSSLVSNVCKFLSRSQRLESALLKYRTAYWLSLMKPIATREVFYPAKAQLLGNIGLFMGCTGDLLQSETVNAAIDILNRLGYSVMLPKNQNCCGAMDLHAGNRKNATELANTNIEAFDNNDLDYIVTLASGCGAYLMEYPEYFPNSHRFSEKIIDINHFLAQHENLAGLKLRPLNAKVCIHSPCSLKNVLRQEKSVAVLVNAIANIDLYMLPESTHCCGAAGSYMIEHPNMANALRDDVLKKIEEIAPDYILTSNIGCALHLKAGLQQRNLKSCVLHPIEFLANQLKNR